MKKWIEKLGINFIKKANNSQGNREITFTNGTKLRFFTAGNPDAIAGNSFDYMFCDEFALWGADAWYIIKPTVAAKKNAKVISVSTPRGMNHFFDMYNVGKSGNERYISFDMSYLDNEMYDIAEVEEARLTYTDIAFRQEFLAEFIKGASDVFGKFSESQTVSSWFNSTPKFFGIDAAGDGSDDTVLTLMDETGEVVNIFETSRGTAPEQEDELYDVLKQFPEIVGYCESNGLGASMADHLAEMGVNVQKFNTNNASKQRCVSQILTDMKEGSISLPTQKLCNKLDNQMCVYIAKRTSTGLLTYSHPKGGHDDYVDSLMLANMARHDLVGTAVTPDVDYNATTSTTTLNY